MYYRESSYHFVESVSMGLKKSLHDIVLRPAHERLLACSCSTSTPAARSRSASFHAAPLTALNSLRRDQIQSALQALERLGPGTPTFMVGDYNYPVFKERLGDQIREHGYDMTLSDSRTYTRYRFFKGHYDFVTSRGLAIDDGLDPPAGHERPPADPDRGRVPPSLALTGFDQARAAQPASRAIS